MTRRTQYLSRSVSATTGCGAKANPSRLQDEVIGDQPRGLQVLLHQGRRHRQRFGRVVEPGLVGGVDGELPGRPDVDARQVADRCGRTRRCSAAGRGPGRGRPRSASPRACGPTATQSITSPAGLGRRVALRLRRAASTPASSCSRTSSQSPGPSPPTSAVVVARSGRGRLSASPCRGSRGSRCRGTGGPSPGSGLRSEPPPHLDPRAANAGDRRPAKASRKPIAVTWAFACRSRRSAAPPFVFC